MSEVDMIGEALQWLRVMGLIGGSVTGKPPTSGPCFPRGHHSLLLDHNRRGPFWARRSEYQCMDCKQTVELREGDPR